MIGGVKITDQQRNIVVNSLYESLIDAERHERGSKVPKHPGPEDECCPAHLNRHSQRRAEHKALKARTKAIRETITLFES